MLGNPARLCLAVAGGPAEVAGWMCECGHQLDWQSDIAACSECGREYRQSREGVTRFEKSFTLVL